MAFEAGKTYKNKLGYNITLALEPEPDGFYVFVSKNRGNQYPIYYSADGKVFSGEDSDYDLESIQDEFKSSHDELYAKMMDFAHELLDRAIAINTTAEGKDEEEQMAIKADSSAWAMEATKIATSVGKYFSKNL